MKKLRAIVEFVDNNYTAYLKEFDGCVGIAETIEEVKDSLKKSLELHIELMQEDGVKVPKILQGEYDIEYSYDLASFLQVYGKIISKAGLEKISGINQKQLWHYANGISKPRESTKKKIEQSIHQLGKELIEMTFV